MKTPAVSQTLGEREATIEQGYALEEQGLVFLDPDLSTWADIGRQLGRTHGSTLWRLGDWLVYGFDHFTGTPGARFHDVGSFYREASQLTGLSPERLCRLHTTARAFPRGRRFGVSWSHHRACNTFVSDFADRLLTQSAEHGWTVDEMALKFPPKAAAGEHLTEPAYERSVYEPRHVKCPQCAHEFEIRGHKLPRRNGQPSKGGVKAAV